MLIHWAIIITSTGFMAVRRDKFSLAHSAISANFSCSRRRQQLRSLSNEIRAYKRSESQPMTANVPAIILGITILLLVEELRDHLGWYCADVSTSMKFGTHVDQTILNSFFESAKAGGHWGRHNRKIQYGRQPILYLVITS